MSNQVVFVSAARTAIGSFGKSLKDVPATHLGAIAVEGAVSRAGIEPSRVGHVVLGNVIHGEPRDAYVSQPSMPDCRALSPA